MKIAKILSREILDSRGVPTVEAEVVTMMGFSARAAVPSGASTGSYEALELRDKDKSRYNGKGVLRALHNIDTIIAPELMGMDLLDQRGIDRTLIAIDGTEDKSNLGANATLAVSLAVAKAAAKSLHLPLYRYIGGASTYIMPVPMMNLITAGRHSHAPVAFQEFMIRPIGASTFSEGLRMGAEIFHALKAELRHRGFSTTVGDEGGFAPAFESIEDVLQTMVLALNRAGYTAGRDVTFALDCAATEFYREKSYDYRCFEGSHGIKLSTAEQIDYLRQLVERYPIDSIEDPLAEDDWAGWQALTAAIGERCQIVGDDLFVTNPRRIYKGITQKCANAVLIKPNQIGTLTETIDAVRMAQHAGYKTIMSHRSGETEDTTIADLAVALGCGEIKCGSLSRGERTAKYNRLLRIEERLGDSAQYGY